MKAMFRIIVWRYKIELTLKLFFILEAYKRDSTKERRNYRRKKQKHSI